MKGILTVDTVVGLKNPCHNLHRNTSLTDLTSLTEYKLHLTIFYHHVDWLMVGMGSNGYRSIKSGSRILMVARLPLFIAYTKQWYLVLQVYVLNRFCTVRPSFYYHIRLTVCNRNHVRGEAIKTVLKLLWRLNAVEKVLGSVAMEYGIDKQYGCDKNYASNSISFIHYIGHRPSGNQISHIYTFEKVIFSHKFLLYVLFSPLFAFSWMPFVFAFDMAMRTWYWINQIFWHNSLFDNMKMLCFTWCAHIA